MLTNAAAALADVVEIADQFIRLHPEGGKRGQAVVAAIFDCVSDAVQAGAINNPRAFDVQVSHAEIPGPRHRGQTEADLPRRDGHLGEAAASASIDEALYAALAPSQPWLDREALVHDAVTTDDVFLIVCTSLHQVVDATVLGSSKTPDRRRDPTEPHRKATRRASGLRCRPRTPGRPIPSQPLTRVLHATASGTFTRRSSRPRRRFRVPSAANALYRRHFKRCRDVGRPYADFTSSPLLQVRTPSDVFDVFFKQRHRGGAPSVPWPSRQSQSKERQHMFPVTAVSATAGHVNADDARSAVAALLDRVDLCSMATVSPSGDAHINTCFYAYALSPLTVWLLTPPSTEHASYLSTNSSVALAVFSTDQGWAKPKAGLQLFGRARRLQDGEVAAALETYGRRFPDFTAILSDSSSLAGLESRFYEVAVSRIRLFDEPTFGSKVWVELKL